MIIDNSSLGLRENRALDYFQNIVDRIFNMFQRRHKKGEFEGTGVGLAICCKKVDRHSGTITARSTPGQGTTFVVTMPVRQLKEVAVL
jgi:signal transduction histidine kinase